MLSTVTDYTGYRRIRLSVQEINRKAFVRILSGSDTRQPFADTARTADIIAKPPRLADVCLV